MSNPATQEETIGRLRTAITLLAFLVSPIASAQSDEIKEAKDDLSMSLNPKTSDTAKSIIIHQEIDFEMSPQRVYEALLDAKQFTAFSGRTAEINREVGGAFSLFNGHIIGRNLELLPNQRIVQAWRVVTWPEGAYSIARIELKPAGSGTHVVFDHVGFPEGLHDHLAQGWEENYWSLLKKYFP
jgi:activator of HSP90 ATPase